MTTMKQKIEMMDNFKSMRGQTQEKLKNAKVLEEKIDSKLSKLEKKEEQHKLSLAKAHLVFEEYKKAFNVLKDILPKKEREAFNATEKAKKSQQSLEEMRRKVAQMDKQYEKQVNSLQVLTNLEKQLQAQLA